MLKENKRKSKSFKKYIKLFLTRINFNKISFLRKRKNFEEQRQRVFGRLAFQGKAA